MATAFIKLQAIPQVVASRFTTDLNDGITSALLTVMVVAKMIDIFQTLAKKTKPTDTPQS
jgi:hypothetical protein